MQVSDAWIMVGLACCRCNHFGLRMEIVDDVQPQIDEFLRFQRVWNLVEAALFTVPSQVLMTFEHNT